jgi:hypothetical protein
MSLLDTLTEADIRALKATVLGTDATSVDYATQFVTEGSTNVRTDLTTDEKIVTRLLNSLEENQTDVLDTVDSFKNRFNSIIGKEFSNDQEAFASIGTNLIQAVAELKTSGGAGEYYWNTL